MRETTKLRLVAIILAFIIIGLGILGTILSSIMVVFVSIGLTFWLGHLVTKWNI